MSSRAVVTIHGPEERDQVARWARNVEPGTVVEFRKKSRSTEQNAKLWAMLGEVSDQVEWYGAKLDPEDWKDMFTASLRHARVVPGIDKGTFVPLGMRTSQMTIAEMTDLIELIHAFGADPAHPVTFKDSDPGEDLPSSAPADESGMKAASSQQPSDTAPSADPGQNVDPAVGPSPNEMSAAGSASLLPEEQPLSADDRNSLVECCSKLMAVRLEEMSVEAKLRALTEAKDWWKHDLPAYLHRNLAGMFHSAQGVIKGTADFDKVINEYAYFLGCTPEELGGAS
jgi:hypothetical protein